MWAREKGCAGVCMRGSESRGVEKRAQGETLSIRARCIPGEGSGQSQTRQEVRDDGWGSPVGETEREAAEGKEETCRSRSKGEGARGEGEDGPAREGGELRPAMDEVAGS
jgi:hypothetical protein